VAAPEPYLESAERAGLSGKSREETFLTRVVEPTRRSVVEAQAIAQEIQLLVTAWTPPEGPVERDASARASHMLRQAMNDLREAADHSPAECALKAGLRRRPQCPPGEIVATAGGSLPKVIGQFNPDVIAVHVGLAFLSAPSAIVGMLTEVKNLRPSLRIGLEGADRLPQEVLDQLDLSIFEDSEEMRKLVSLFF
jgi:hypothetical protein